MKFIRTFLVTILLFLTVIQPAFAHLPGQPPFFRANGQFTSLYPVQTMSVVDFVLPQDIAPEPYLVNTPIEFEMDTTQMMIPQEIVEKTTFIWDFGDGEIGEGLRNMHTYSKIGSYIMTIHATSEEIPEPQLIQSTLVHIVPEKDYKLPASIIKINGKQSADPLLDILKASFQEDIEFDGTFSRSGNKIVSYFWDLGDETTSTEPKLTHKLPNMYYMAFPVLRIKDENGFISDSYVQLNNTTRTDSEESSPSFFDSKITKIGIALIPILLITPLVFILIKRGHRKK